MITTFIEFNPTNRFNTVYAINMGSFTSFLNMAMVPRGPCFSGFMSYIYFLTLLIMVQKKKKTNREKSSC